MHAEHHSLSVQGDTLDVTSMCGVPGQGREWIEGHLIQLQLPDHREAQEEPHGGERCVVAPP